MPWKHVMDAVNAALGSEPLPVVPFTEWLHKLEEVAVRADNDDASTIVSLTPMFWRVRLPIPRVARH